ncbi:MAG: PfkB family carbohydrate kinase [Acidobacteriota bacterium]|nr:PfkB family carbohydrate kinase [Acidobacteriota bacterium]
MIHVVGGAYAEHCVEPLWDQFFGSGVRAAAALRQLSGKATLHTYANNDAQPLLSYMAAVYGFEVGSEPSPAKVQFQYYHALSAPRIIPAPHTITPAAPLTVEAPNILRFGFIEGDAVVHGAHVVYDPQDGDDPKSFRSNGSTAAKLAVVANAGECIKLAGDRFTGGGPEALGKAVLEAEGAEVVVMKRGAVGALVITTDDTRSIPAYRTTKVWPIGSGDVFSSTFAYHWAEAGVDVFGAASLASLSTAFYCESKSLHIPTNLVATFTPPEAIIGPGEFPSKSKQVYLAGPFFTMAQRWLIEQSLSCLKEQGFVVFSPLHDVGYGPASKVVPADLKALNDSDIVFAVVDGLDAGTLFEVGYARSIGKPVIVFVQNETEGSLKMMTGSGCEIVSDFASAIYRAAWACMAL